MSGVTPFRRGVAGVAVSLEPAAEPLAEAGVEVEVEAEVEVEVEAEAEAVDLVKDEAAVVRPQGSVSTRTTFGSTTGHAANDSQSILSLSLYLSLSRVGVS